MNESPTDATLESNSYAVAYRLLGDRPAARAVAGIASQRVRQLSEPMPHDWLALLVDYTVRQTVGPGAVSVTSSESDPNQGIRTALRRRLERATVEERTAAALIHLAGYSAEFTADVLGCSVEEAIDRAAVLAAPPGVAYRDLGDPELTGGPKRDPATRLVPRLPHWTTIIAVVVIAFLVFYATQITGPRPTLVEEGGMGVGVTWVRPGDTAGA